LLEPTAYLVILWQGVQHSLSECPEGITFMHLDEAHTHGLRYGAHVWCQSADAIVDGRDVPYSVGTAGLNREDQSRGIQCVDEVRRDAVALILEVRSGKVGLLDVDLGSLITSSEAQLPHAVLHIDAP